MALFTFEDLPLQFGCSLPSPVLDTFETEQQAEAEDRHRLASLTVNRLKLAGHLQREVKPLSRHLQSLAARRTVLSRAPTRVSVSSIAAYMDADRMVGSSCRD